MAMSTLRLALVLGLMGAIGPFAVDMYLPALPAIAADLGANVATTQITLTAFFLAFGGAQLIYGPLADRYGRKPPLYVGLTIFLIGSIGCGLAGDITALSAWRFVQGLGAAAVMVVPRAVIRDVHTGNEATRLMAMIMLVISVSPMLAPLAGTGLLVIGGWRDIFFVLAGAAALSFALTLFRLPETLPVERRQPIDAATLFRDSIRLLTDRTFMLLTFVGGFGMASFFVFVASASFVYTQQYELSALQFSLAFAVNAIGFFAASQFAASLGMRFGMKRVVATAVIGFAFCELVLLALVLVGLDDLVIVVALLFLGNVCLGLVIPTTMVMALDEHGDVAGLASSLGGTLQMVAGGVIIALCGPFFDGTVTPMVVAIAACATIALILSRLAVSSEQARAGV